MGTYLKLLVWYFFYLGKPPETGISLFFGSKDKYGHNMGNFSFVFFPRKPPKTGTNYFHTIFGSKDT